MAGYRWDPTRGRYRDPRGRLVSPVMVRAELDLALRSVELRIRALAIELRSGRLALTAWRLEMRSLIKSTHLMSSALAHGGRQQMGPASFGQAGRFIRAEYGYLERFAGEIARGLPLDGRFAARAAQYAHAGRDTYHAAERAEMRARGFAEERNVLHPAEHCEGDGSCIEQSGRGWVPIGQLVPIGRRVCRRGCKCTLTYRKAAA